MKKLKNMMYITRMQTFTENWFGRDLITSIPSKPMSELVDKVAIVTGAAGGIGSLVVENLLKENIKHVAILDVAEAAGLALKDKLNSKYGNKVSFYKCDVTKEDQLLDAFKSTVDKNGSLDILINNAGILNDSWEKYKLQLDLNVKALVTSTLRGMELMRKDKGGNGGVIVNISSVAALCQIPLSSIYNASKSAVLMFSNCIGMDDFYLRTKVKVITICFGATDTPLLSMDNMGSFDPEIHNRMDEPVKMLPSQRPESAAEGLMVALKKGESGSTWLVNANKPAQDITEKVKEAYGILTKLVFDN